MRTLIKDKTFDEERALYNLKDACLDGCVFEGPADGESALKEAEDIIVNNCRFELRYPLWHVKGFTMQKSVMSDTSRAAVWYSRDCIFDDCTLGGIKAVRECESVTVKNSRINSPEFGWKSKNIRLADTEITAEYLLLDTKDIKLSNVKMKGKYSFQYTENVLIENSELDTKDAFWHAKNVTVINSVVKGEYLGWFSEGLTLINCKIIGTQPLCYCKNLKLKNCTTEGCDLAFEYSDVEADIHGEILSVKNPKSGIIIADGFGEIIRDNAVYDCKGEVKVRSKQNIGT